jgi:hypothetical protein
MLARQGAQERVQSPFAAEKSIADVDAYLEYLVLQTRIPAVVLTQISQDDADVSAVNSEPRHESVRIRVQSIV